MGAAVRTGDFTRAAPGLPQASGALAQLWLPTPARPIGPHREGGGQTPGTRTQEPTTVAGSWQPLPLEFQTELPLGAHTFAARKMFIPTQPLLFFPLRLRDKDPPSSHSKIFLVTTLNYSHS